MRTTSAPAAPIGTTNVSTPAATPAAVAAKPQPKGSASDSFAAGGVSRVTAPQGDAIDRESAAIDAIVTATLCPGQRQELHRLADVLTRTQEPLGGWRGAEGDASCDRNTSVLGHAALSALLKSGAFAADEPMRLRLEASLMSSWCFLTGKLRPEGKLLDPLPHKVLRSVHAMPQAFACAVSGAAPNGKTLDPVLQRALAHYNGEPPPADAATLPPKTAMLGLLAAAAGAEGAVHGGTEALMHALAAAGGPALQFGAGFALSYAIASLAESTMHDKVHHASKETREVWKKLGKVGEWLQNAYISHTGVHHGSTFKTNHVTQFPSEEAREKLTQRLIAQGRGNIVDENFGVTLTLRHMLNFGIPVLPAYAGSILGAAMLGAGPAAYVGMAVPAMMLPLASKVLHPYLHMTADEIDKKAPAPLRWLLGSSLGRYIARHHFVHHAREDEDVNYNLMPGGDYLRGKAAAPNPEELAEMKRIGMLV